MTLITALNTVATSGKSFMPTGSFNEYRVEKKQQQKMNM